MSDLSTLEGGTLSIKTSSKPEKEEAASKRNDELNILLVVVGLLAATITAFIIYIQPQLQQDPGEETAALLRVLIYNLNNSAFGGEVPTVPTFAGAPAILTVAQIVLYCSLAATLLCGFYALILKFFTDSAALGWKNRFLDWATRWVFFTMYLFLAGVFVGMFVALTLQVPFLPSTATFGALGRIHT